MTDKQALRKLIEAVEAGVWVPDCARDVFGTTKDPYYIAYRTMNGSLDAAKALHEALLPEWRVKELRQFEAGHWIAAVYHPQGDDWPKWMSYPCHEAVNSDPARAWLLAILKAVEAKQWAVN